MNSFGWLLRREVWEHRALYLMPLILIGVLLAGHAWAAYAVGSGSGAIAANGVPITGTELAASLENSAETRRVFKAVAGGGPFIIPAVALNVAMLLLLFFYLTDSLYGDRKDRSILFWKSLPVSDAATTLSKLATAMVVAPALAFVAILICAAGMALINTVFAWAIGVSAAEFIWKQIPFVSAPLSLLYWFAVQSLWYAPVFAWLLLASAWARSSPALWAVLPVAGLALVEGAVFRTQNFLELVEERLMPVVPSALHDAELASVMHGAHEGDDSIDWSRALDALVDPLSFLANPALLIGLVVAAGFVATAIWLRRYRDET